MSEIWRIDFFWWEKSSISIRIEISSPFWIAYRFFLTTAELGPKLARKKPLSNQIADVRVARRTLPSWPPKCENCLPSSKKKKRDTPPKCNIDTQKWWLFSMYLWLQRWCHFGYRHVKFQGGRTTFSYLNLPSRPPESSQNFSSKTLFPLMLEKSTSWLVASLTYRSCRHYPLLKTNMFRCENCLGAIFSGIRNTVSNITFKQLPGSSYDTNPNKAFLDKGNPWRLTID